MIVLAEIKKYIKDVFYAILPLLEYFNIYVFSKRGLKGLDNKLEKYLDYKAGFFIEVGGNDGITQSNTYYLEKAKNWNGILIEGIPELYRKCKMRRLNSTVYNYALVPKDFNDEYIEMDYANLMSVVEKTNFNRSDHIKTGSEIQGIKKSYKVKVKTEKLENLLNMQNIDYVDFFSLDVEGFELEVLQGIDLNKIKIKYILIEIDDINYKNKIENYLGSRYKMVDKLSYHDYLYKLV